MASSVEKTPFETSSLDGCLLEWQSFLDGISDESRVAIIYHGDADGAVAAAVIERVLSQRLAHSPLLYWVGTDEYDFGDLELWLKTLSITHLIFLDISIENEPEILTSIVHLTGAKVFIFDHHLLRGDRVPLGVVLANPTPKRLTPGDMPVPSFAFALAISRTNRLSFPSWLLIYLCFAEGVETFVEPYLQNLTSTFFPKSPEQSLRDWYRNSRLARLGGLIRAAFSEEGKSNNVVKMLRVVLDGQSNSYEDFLAELESRFAPSANRISQRINEFISSYEARLPEYHSNLIIIKIDDVHAVAGPVASILRGKVPGKTVMTWIRKRDVTVCELRTGTQSQTNLVEILKRVSAKVAMVNFGGHASAAGALVLNDNFDRFQKTLQDIVET